MGQPADPNWPSNLWLNTFVTPTRDTLKIGPLPTGVELRLEQSLYVADLGYSPTLGIRTLKLTPGETLKLSEAVDGVELGGRLTGGDGKPLAGVNVLVKTKDGTFARGAVTDADGAYRISGIPVGTHELRLLRHQKRTAPG
jgi:hypothetical protein